MSVPCVGAVVGLEIETALTVKVRVLYTIYNGVIMLKYFYTIQGQWIIGKDEGETIVNDKVGFDDTIVLAAPLEGPPANLEKEYMKLTSKIDLSMTH